MKEFLFFFALKEHKVTVDSVHSNLVKIHSKSPSVMGFCPVCLGILPYSWQNTSRDITCEQLRNLSVHIVLNHTLQVLFILLPYIFRSDNPHPEADTGNPAKEL